MEKLFSIFSLKSRNKKIKIPGCKKKRKRIDLYDVVSRIKWLNDLNFVECIIHKIKSLIKTSLFVKYVCEVVEVC